MLSHMVVKLFVVSVVCIRRLRVVLSHMVVKPNRRQSGNCTGLRVVLSHMVVKLFVVSVVCIRRLRVVLSHMVVKLRD